MGIGYLRRGGLATHGARVARAAGLILATACALACSSAPSTPEDQIRAVLAELEASHDTQDEQRVDNADAQGNDKRAIAQLVAFHLLRNQSVYLLTRVSKIAITEPGQGSAEVFVAMAGTPIAGPEALLGLRADLYRFDLQLENEPDGAWRILSAEWRPAAVDDFR